MKKFVVCLSVILLIAAVIASPLSAGSSRKGDLLTENVWDTESLTLSNVQRLPDGGYIEVHVGRVVDSGYSAYSASEAKAAASYIVEGYKVATAYNSSGGKIWQFYVYGRFTVNPGVNYNCIDNWTSQTAYSPWHVDSASSYHSAAQAIGTAKFVNKLLFVVIDTNLVTIYVNCDKNGNIS